MYCDDVMLFCCAHVFEFLHGAPYAVCVEEFLSLCFVLEVLFVSCVAVCGCGCCWGEGVTYGSLCDGNMWGESGRLCCIRCRE